jgi:hypothetical protein
MNSKAPLRAKNSRCKRKYAEVASAVPVNSKASSLQSMYMEIEMLSLDIYRH